MTKFAVAGDWHGNYQAASTVMRRAREYGCYNIIQVGDFGIWPNSDWWLEDLDRKAKSMMYEIYFVDGNHEDFPQLYSYQIDKKTGFRHLRETILHIPRGFKWQVDDVWFKGMGGAPSIDRGWRKEGVSWWPEEEITYSDLDYAESSGLAEVLFTHDAPTSIEEPFPWLLTGEQFPAGLRGRQYMDLVAGWTRPYVWFHGHYHQFAEYKCGKTKVISLDKETDKNAFVILDTEKRTVVIPDQGDRIVHW